MNAADYDGAAKQIQISVRESTLDVVHIFVGETELLQCQHRVLHVQDQSQFPNAHGFIFDC